MLIVEATRNITSMVLKQKFLKDGSYISIQHKLRRDGPTLPLALFLFSFFFSSLGEIFVTKIMG